MLSVLPQVPSIALVWMEVSALHEAVRCAIARQTSQGIRASMIEIGVGVGTTPP